MQKQQSELVCVDINNKFILGKINFDLFIKNKDISAALCYRPTQNLKLKCFDNEKISATYKNDNGLKIYFENNYISIGNAFSEKDTDISLYFSISDGVNINGFFDKPTHSSGFGISFITDVKIDFYVLKPFNTSSFGLYCKLPNLIKNINFLYSRHTQSSTLIGKFSPFGEKEILMGNSTFRWKCYELSGKTKINKNEPVKNILSAKYKGEIFHVIEPKVRLNIDEHINYFSIGGNLNLPKIGSMKVVIDINPKAKNKIGFNFALKTETTL